VQRLLAHLAAAGFTGAPRPHGLDGDTELVEFLPGEVGHDFGAPLVRSDAALVAAARLLRRLHDATADFPLRPEEDVWQLPVRTPVEVVCHGDAATYNTVFRDGLPVAFIDFDTAHPGPRLWDVAYTAYRFVPLYAPDAAEGPVPVPEARRRLRLFADGYGLSGQELRGLGKAVAERLEALVDFMHAEADAGHPAFARHVAEGHDLRYRTDARWALSQFSDLGYIP
jgi:aminoglycoside phosphotransferase (APT) family kinase protein